MKNTNVQMSFKEEYARRSARIGTIMIPIIIASMFLPVIYLKLAYGVFPDWDVAFTAWITVAAAFGAFYFVEPLSYYPILGLAGTYMAFTAGNIAEIRMPASSVAQQVVGVEYGSDKGSVISTLGIAGSLMTTLLVVFGTAIFGTALVQLFPESLLEGVRSYTVPSIFAATYIQFCKLEPKLSWLIILTTVIFILIAGFSYGLMMVVCVAVPVMIARVMYKKGVFNKSEKSE